MVNLYIAVSKSTKSELIKKAHIDQKKIAVLYNFVDLDKFNPNNVTWNVQKERQNLGIRKDEFLIGFAGRIIERKGWREFVEAAKRTNNEKELKFLIAGDGSQKKELLRLIEEDHLAERVTYLGYVSNMVWFYSLLDCFVLPSHWEPFGLIALEAQAMGIPVLAADIQGLNEFVNNQKDAFLFKKKSVEEISSNLLKLRRSKSIRYRLRKQGIINSKKYRVNPYLDQLRRVYSIW